MQPTDLLSIQIVFAVLGLWWQRRALRGRWPRLLRLLLFVAAATYSFDYIANDRGIWLVSPGWDFTVIINPLENILFAVSMAIHLVLLNLAVETCIATSSH